MTRAALPNEYDALREMIVMGKILPNERIVEATYAELLGTNRANIRRALARLEQEGLIVSEPFRGARVRRVTQDEAVEIFEVRGALEVLLVQHATEWATQSDKERLRVLRKKLNDALPKNDPVAVGAVSRQMREELWRMSRHAIALQIVGSLNSQLVRIWFQSIMMPGRAESIVADMNDLCDAIDAGSAPKAAKAMRRYHDAAIAALKTAFARNAGPL
ncbi:MAG: GntR family transcriptional regulator [Pseudomonadota bacterium]